MPVKIACMNLREPDLASDAVVRAGVVSVSVHPTVIPTTVTDPVVLDQGRVFAEAVNQTRSLATGDSEMRQVASMIRRGTGQPRGVSRSAAERMATQPRSLDSFTHGPNPRGLAAEVVAVSDYRALHAGTNPGIVNAPDHVSPSVRDIRLAPDTSSRKDLVLGIDMKGRIVWKYNGQVKTGRANYVCNSLVKMANTPEYGKVAYVDARYVNPDGSPRVSSDAFTSGQARRLQEAQVRLRGIPDLEARADQLITDISSSKSDGLDPVARKELQFLRDDIATAYSARGVLGRIGGGAAMAAASAAVVSLVVQLATEGDIDAKAVGKSAGIAALFGIGGVAADTGLYHLGTHTLMMTPEAGREFAKQGVSVGFGVISVGTDLLSEVGAVRRGEVTIAGAIGGASAKAALDLLPLALALFGVPGLPILVGAQVGGRLLVEKVRKSDHTLEHETAIDQAQASDLKNRMSAFTTDVEESLADCIATDDIFTRLMAEAPPRRTAVAAVPASRD